MKSQIKNKECLIGALCDMGFRQEDLEIHEQATHLYGWHGDKRAQNANIIIRRKYIGSSSNDIGFTLNEDGTYTAIISEFDKTQMGYNKEWMGKLTQKYNTRMVLKTCIQKGLPARVQNRPDGSVKVVIQAR